MVYHGTRPFRGSRLLVGRVYRRAVAELAYAVEDKPRKDAAHSQSLRAMLTAKTDGGDEHDRSLHRGFESRLPFYTALHSEARVLTMR